MEGELKGLILLLTHWVCTSEAPSLRSNPHEAAYKNPGGKYTFLEYARLSKDEGAKAIVPSWKSRSKYDRRRAENND